KGELKSVTAFIEKNSTFWGGSGDNRSIDKSYYENLSNGKCWFSEAYKRAAPYEMDHFRPKKEVINKKGDTPEIGYWWLAFEWSNFRIIEKLLNTNKSILFPVEGDRATPLSSIASEINYLLDPTCWDDIGLLFFDESGNA